MSKTQPEPFRVYITIIAGFIWLLFLALWLIFYAESYSIIQNIGVFLASIVAVGIIAVLLWVPWSFKNS